MTPEEARAEGWPEDEIPGYLAGRAEAEARIAAIMAPSGYQQTAAQPAALSPTEVQAAMTMRAALAADSAAMAARKAQPPVITVERPEDGPTTAERRAWALEKAREYFPQVLRPGDEPRGDIVLRMPDGSPRVVQDMTPLREPEVIRPGEWEEHEARWQFRQRREDNERLVKMYGLDACVDAGIITRSDATEMELHKVRQVTLPPGSPR